MFAITDGQERKESNFLSEGRDEYVKPRSLSPNIDRLATEGQVLLNQYVSSPVYTPSRYAVLTGTYASLCAANLSGHISTNQRRNQVYEETKSNI